jgi:RimJ/RimL family protein N-acetyltransferase
VVERVDERARVAWRLGPVIAARAAMAKRHSVPRQVGLVLDVQGMSVPSIPESGPLVPADAAVFDGFAQLVSETPPSALLELLWYQRFAREGAETFLVASDRDGRPTFSTWMLDADGQQRHSDRFLGGFHRLGRDEMLLEGIFVFPPFRGRGIAGAGIAAACAWAAGQGANKVWCYPYLDNHAILPPLARCGFVPRHSRVESSSLGQVQARQEALTRKDRLLWEQASQQTPATR